MSPPPVVSVLLPARNAAVTLESCLRSIQRQRLTSWECILVDDGSTDETGRLASAFAARDPRVHLLSIPPAGLVAALNHGLTRCRAPLVARMDSDDLMHRDRLAAQVELLASAPQVAAVGCHVRMFPRRALTDGRRAYEAWLNSFQTAEDVRRDAFVECPVAHPALMVRRAVLLRFGYRDVAWAEDYDLVLRMLAAGERVGSLPRRLVSWRDGDRRLSRVDPRYARERFTACKAHFLASGFLAARDRFVLWGYGDTGKALVRALEPYGKRPTLILEVHPGRIGQCIGGVRVVGLDALPAMRGDRIVVSVAGAGPRAEIRAHLEGLHFVELEDFICAA